jgi:hypothetical protein
MRAMTIAKAVEGSTGMLETKNTNGLDGGAEIPHSEKKTMGQRAMAVAKIYPGGSGKGANPKNLGLSGELIRQARRVLALHAGADGPIF